MKLFRKTLVRQLGGESHKINITVNSEGMYIKSLQGLASYMYIVIKEKCVYMGARKPGTGPQNWKRFLKSFGVWNKDDIDVLLEIMRKNKVDIYQR